MSDEFIPTLTHATERDIDLLLVEELYASPAFTAWITAQTNLTVDIEMSSVLHSKRRTRSRREIDIFVDLRSKAGKRCAILIENKLDADDQPDQAESYREELARISEDYSAASMLIVCPEAYARAHPVFTGKFDGVVTYEALVDYFDRAGRERTGEGAARARFRQGILEQAINKHRRGYTPIPNKNVGDFNARYVALLAEIAPSVRPGKSMLKPSSPDESTSMIFDHVLSLPELPSDLLPRRFSHELGRGQDHRAHCVAVTFGGWGRSIKALKDTIEADMAPIGAFVSADAPTKARPNPGLVVACPTPPVFNQGIFSDQRALLIRGIEQTVVLRDWLQGNVSRLRAWKVVVDQH